MAIAREVAAVTRLGIEVDFQYLDSLFIFLKGSKTMLSFLDQDFFPFFFVFFVLMQKGSAFEIM